VAMDNQIAFIEMVLAVITSISFLIFIMVKNI
jgi:hypothetical protein